MSWKEDPNPQAKESEEEYLSRLREAVETALQHFGKLEDANLVRNFSDSLSTIPERVASSISERSLRDKCYNMSLELQRCLDLAGVRTETHGSTYSYDGAAHTFLAPTETPYDIIIDPSIGQFILGHNHVFAGTRDQLRSLVLETHPERFFEINWDTRSLPISQLRLSSPSAYYAAWFSEPTTPISLPPAEPE